MSLYLGNNLIAPNQSNAANKSLSNLDSTGQSILDNKADISFSNVNDTAKILMSGMGMPSNTYIDLSLGAAGSTYTAPTNGWVYWRFSIQGNGYAEIGSGSRSLLLQLFDGGQGIHALPVNKGETFSVQYQSITFPSYTFFRFFYAKGSESEAS